MAKGSGGTGSGKGGGDVKPSARQAAYDRASSFDRVENIQMVTGRNNRVSTKKVRKLRSKTVTNRLKS